jgi:hypothetical protein
VQRLKYEEARFDDWSHILFDQALLAEGGAGRSGQLRQAQRHAAGHGRQVSSFGMPDHAGRP